VKILARQEPVVVAETVSFLVPTSRIGFEAEGYPDIQCLSSFDESGSLLKLHSKAVIGSSWTLARMDCRLTHTWSEKDKTRMSVAFTYHLNNALFG
jgi:hypothetical protein